MLLWDRTELFQKVEVMLNFCSLFTYVFQCNEPWLSLHYTLRYYIGNFPKCTLKYNSPIPLSLILTLFSSSVSYLLNSLPHLHYFVPFSHLNLSFSLSFTLSFPSYFHSLSCEKRTELFQKVEVMLNFCSLFTYVFQCNEPWLSLHYTLRYYIGNFPKCTLKYNPFFLSLFTTPKSLCVCQNPLLFSLSYSHFSASIALSLSLSLSLSLFCPSLPHSCFLVSLTLLSLSLSF